MAQWWSGSDFEIFCSDEAFKKLGKENVISVLNHYYEIDWLLGWVLCQRINVLGVTKILILYMILSIHFVICIIFNYSIVFY